MEKVKIDDVLKYEQPTKYIVESQNYSNDFKTPVLTAGKSFILGYTDEENGIFDNLPAIIFDDFTTAFHYVDFPFKVKSSAMKILKTVKEKADLKYLFYRMQTISIDKDLHKRYWISKYSQIQIPLPPLQAQQKIAKILDTADQLRQYNKQLIVKYDALTQSLFGDMFGDLVRNEKGWKKKKLEEICEFENGDRSSNYPSGNDIKKFGKLFLSSGDIQNGKFIVKDSKYISEEKFNSLKRGRCIKGDVLMTLRGNGTGKSAVFDCKFEEGFINAQMVIIRPNEKCLSQYLVFQLNFPQIFKRLVNLNSGSAQPQLSATSVKGFEVFLPPIELQNQFAERVQMIETQKQQAQEALAKSEDLFQSLLQRAFKGS